MATVSERGASTLWIVMLTVASTVATLAFACATPFAALAALAATQMRRRDGLALIAASWAASQAVGFCVLGYPRDPSTIAWGLGLGTAALGAVLAARPAAARVGGSPLLAIGTAFLAAFLAFKLVVLLWASGLGGVEITLSPVYTTRAFLREGAMLAGLWLFYRALVTVGLPAAPRQAVVAA